MKRLTYWKDVPVEGKAWATFHLVPRQSFDETHTLFNDILDIVRKSNVDYEVIEVSEKLVEQSHAV